MKFNLKKIFKSAKKIVGDNASTGLAVIAIAGVVATAYFASKETPAAVERLDEHEDADIPEKVGIIVGSYPKTGIAMGVTIGAIAASKWIDHQTIISLSAVAASQYNQLKRQNKAIEKLPDEERKKVNEEIIHEYLFAPDETSAIRTGHGNVLVLEPQTGQFMYSCADHILNTAARLNNDASKRSEEYILLNDFFRELGLNVCDFGEIHAFATNGRDPAMIDVFFDDGHTREGIPYLVIRYGTDPVEI